MASSSASESVPLQPPPPGQISNFDNPESRGPAMVILCSVFIGIMWPILILRPYSKAWIIRRFGWDDGKPDKLPYRKLLMSSHSLCHCCRGWYHISNPVLAVILSPTR